VKHQLGAAVAITAMILAAGAPLLSAAAPGYLTKILSGEPGTQGRPPSMDALAPAHQGAVLAMAGPSTDARDDHVLEFLRWKERHNAMRRTVSQ
jgi:hypothetical protein